MQVTFWTEDQFYFISHCRNLFNEKLKKIINKQKIVYSQANALCSSEEPLHIKH